VSADPPGEEGISGFNPGFTFAIEGGNLKFVFMGIASTPLKM